MSVLSKRDYEAAGMGQAGTNAVYQQDLAKARAPGVRQAMELTEATINEVGNLLGELESRLEFVMVPPQESTQAGTGLATKNISTLADQIHAYAQHTGNLGQRIRTILDRLDL